MSKKVITGVSRLSYANLWEPKASVEGATPKYSVSVIIPKSDKKTVADIRKAIEEALQEGIGKFGGRKPAVYKNPLRDGDVERPDDPAYKDSYFVNANSITQPKIVDRNVLPILEHSEIYSGVYARVSLSFYAFNRNGNKGVACGLGNVQKIRDGEPLGGGSRAEDDFQPYEGGDDLLF